ALMAIRDPLYREIADITIDTDGRSPKSVSQELAKLLS
ncbi:MAG: shikimate kinase, partial [Paraglaciecola psychrophila]